MNRDAVEGRPCQTAAQRFVAEQSGDRVRHRPDVPCGACSQPQSLSLDQDAFAFERFMQQRLDISLVWQAFGLGESLRECDVGLWQPDREQPRQYGMKRGL